MDNDSTLILRICIELVVCFHITDDLGDVIFTCRIKTAHRELFDHLWVKVGVIEYPNLYCKSAVFTCRISRLSQVRDRNLELVCRPLSIRDCLEAEEVEFLGAI